MDSFHTVMNLKRLFKGPLPWIILITVVVFAVLGFANSADGFNEVKTATMVSYLDDGKVKDVKFVEGDRWWRPGHAVRQVQGKADEQGHPEDHVR